MVGKASLRWLSAAVLSVAMVAASVGPGLAVSAPPGSGDDAIFRPGVDPIFDDEAAVQRLLDLDLAFTTRRTAGDTQLSNEQAGEQRAAAADKADSIRKQGPSIGAPITFNSPWSALGPNPIVQGSRNVSGRIGALAIRPSNHQFILGAAQGGIWLYDPTTKTWSPKTDNLPSLAVGALAVAPTNDAIVYAGTGEGALSGDSYFGNGVMKSSDGGNTWKHVSGDFFQGVSISRLVVDPNDASHVLVSVLRGRGGSRRVTPPVHSTYGVWESMDGGSEWTLLKSAPGASLGATDLRMDPQNTHVLYTSFWSDRIYKSTDGGATWAPVMTGLPAGDFVGAATRFALSVSHPAGQSAVLYTGFDWNDAVTGVHQPARVFKSTDEGATWSIVPSTADSGSLAGYCGGQCFYDNVIEADPTNPNVIFAAGQVRLYRSDDGGTTWKNLFSGQHPDYHALAFDTTNTAHVLIGSDGGVWFSLDRGGRPNATDPLNAVTWQNLNGGGLQITQLTSIANVATIPAGLSSERFWGGTQDNGTIRKSVNSLRWFDEAGGDGGQVLVDNSDTSTCLPLNTAGCFVFGTYFGISPYRFTDGGVTAFGNQFILNGLNTTDRAEFYLPFVMNQLNTNQLFTGTFRLYRTDNAKTSLAGDVLWKAISPDLTSGCTGTAPNGARGCFISAIGVGGGQAVYTGSDDGFVYFSPDAQVNPNPTWTRLGNSGENSQGEGNGNDNHGDGVKLPRRPVSQFAVDRSNYRVAYASYAGFNKATAGRPGHVFKTTDAGQTWRDASGNLPDSPVNSIVLDPSYPNTLYAGTDVGPFVTHNGGATWSALGTGFPIVSVWQLDLDPSHRILAAGTHGRGAFRIQDPALVPALVLSKTDDGTPVGPGSNINYTLTVHNIGTADATGVTITDRLPAHTSFVSADSGGTVDEGRVTWSGLTVPKGMPGPGGSVSVHLTVRISPSLNSSVTSITNNSFKVTSAQRQSATGSPTVTHIAPPFAVSLAPSSQTGGAHTGQSVKYNITLKNLGFKTDSYNMSAGGGTYTVSFLDASCTTPMTTTGSASAGATVNVCVKVDVPLGAAGGASSTSTVTATSVGSPTVSASGTIKTIAVTTDTLLVDNDGNGPDVNAFYTAALNSAGVPFTLWDLSVDPNLPPQYITAFKNIVWFTGASYPAPISPYEKALKAYLDGGGNLFMNGQDLLDQAAGTTAFVSNYLHISWDGSERQNDIPTNNVNGVAANPITGGIGTVPLDLSVLGPPFMDQLTLTAGALPAFTEDAGATDGLTFSGTYKVVFLAFPFEEYGTAASGGAAQRADLMKRVVVTFFGS